MPDINHKPVFEVSPSFRVKVTQKHIDNAIACNGKRCMVTEAVIDSYPGMAHYTDTDTQTIRFSDLDKSRRYYYLTPRRVQALILAFDRGERKAIKPFSFDLRHAQVRESGWLGQRSKSASRKGKRYGKRTRRMTHPSNLPRGTRRMFGMCNLPENALSQHERRA